MERLAQEEEHKARCLERLRQRAEKQAKGGTYIDRLVAKESLKRAEEEMEDIRRSRRADNLRKRGAEWLLETEEGAGEEKNGAVRGVTIRRPSERELGLLYAWLYTDEREGGTPWWDKASGGLQELWESAEKCAADGTEAPPDTSQLLGVWDAGALGGATEVEEGRGKDAAVPPLAFVVTKGDGWTIDAVGVRLKQQGRGVGGRVLEYFLKVARGAGAAEYFVDAIPTSVSFWSKHGFTMAPVDEATRVFERFSSDRKMVLALAPPTTV